MCEGGGESRRWEGGASGGRYGSSGTGEGFLKLAKMASGEPGLGLVAEAGGAAAAEEDDDAGGGGLRW